MSADDRPVGDREALGDGGETASWPAGIPFDAALAVPARCDACGLAWRVHRSLAGFRLRCRCGAWVGVGGAPRAELPAPAGAPRDLAAAGPSSLAADAELDAPLAPAPAEFAAMRSWDGGPLRPDPDGAWTLRHASVDDRARWTSRTVLELAGVVACFLVPGLVLLFATEGEARLLWQPAASVAASLLVVAVAGTWRSRALEGLRGAAPRYFVEAVLVGLGEALLAIGWVELLVRTLPSLDDDFEALRAWGLPLTLFVVGVLPGVFEEIAFRGLIQARLTVLCGKVQGALIGATAFALAHGVTIGLPFHFGGGVYLSFLRTRSGSLLPGMVNHALYNGAIVLWLWRRAAS